MTWCDSKTSLSCIMVFDLDVKEMRQRSRVSMLIPPTTQQLIIQISGKHAKKAVYSEQPQSIIISTNRFSFFI